MRPLSEDLQSPKKSLDEFAKLTSRIINYFPNIISDRVCVKGYLIYVSEVAGTKKFVRPINGNLFIFQKY